MFDSMLYERRWVLPGLVSVMLAGCAATQRTTSEQRSMEQPEDAVRLWSFDRDNPGRLPSGWSVHETNPTQSLATWRVVKDPTALSAPNVLALTDSANYDGTFNLAVAEGMSFKDLDLTLQAKAVAGKEDQGGGPVWRYKDENNYYICRFNPLEGNFRVYVVLNGKRRQLQSTKVDLQADRWYALRVTMLGDRIQCYLDGVLMLEATDGTFPEAGTVGLWTKADAVTSFDDLKVALLRDGA